MDLIDRQVAIEALFDWEMNYTWDEHCKEEYDAPYIVSPSKVIEALPSAEPEIIRCKDCKHNPKDEWFGCPMSHLSEAQRPETAWCWKAERRTDG